MPGTALVPHQTGFARLMMRRSRSSPAWLLRQMMYLWIMLACVPGDLGMLEGALSPILSQGRAAVDGAPKRDAADTAAHPGCALAGDSECLSRSTRRGPTQVTLRRL